MAFIEENDKCKSINIYFLTNVLKVAITMKSAHLCYSEEWRSLELSITLNLIWVPLEEGNIDPEVT